MYIIDECIGCLGSQYVHPRIFHDLHLGQRIVIIQTYIIFAQILVKGILHTFRLNERAAHIHIFHCHIDGLRGGIRKFLAHSFRCFLISGDTDHHHKQNRHKKTHNNLVADTKKHQSGLAV